ncbi:putative lipase domain protein [Wolbachia endosymbiont of Wuchereria bancrofti]|nr:putative lipase domain protein [Wolbachia endosymbiont of Wuchereria bancrofti]
MSSGLLGYAYVGVQLRVSASEEYHIYTIDGHEAIYRTDKSNSSQIMKYLFSTILLDTKHVNSKVLGNAQYYAANT